MKTRKHHNGRLHQQLTTSLKADSSLSDAEKLNFARMLAGMPDARKPHQPGQQQVPDWLVGEFEARASQQHQQALRETRRAYLFVTVAFAGGSVLLALTLLALVTS